MLPARVQTQALRAWARPAPIPRHCALPRAYLAHPRSPAGSPRAASQKTTEPKATGDSAPRSPRRFALIANRPFIRHLSGSPLPQTKSKVLNFTYRAAAWLGSSIAFVGLGVVGFFVYDASTYKEAANNAEICVPQSALNPRRGGPKNLPILDAYLDDHESEATKSHLGKPKLVILGGGWGSVAILKELNPDDYNVTLISPTNYFLFTPMLPSATVGTLELKSLVEPIRRILHRVRGHFLRANAEDVDFSHKLVEVSQKDASGREVRFYVPYDKLVIGVGSSTNPHGVKGLENCYFLKDIRDARKIRNQVVHNLELASLPTTSDEERRRLLSFVISGGGPTGVEFAAELCDLLNEDLTLHFPKLLRNQISVHLIQSRSHVLNTYDEKISKYAEERFARDQIKVLTNSRVSEVKPDSIIFTQKGPGGELITKELPMGFCLWSTELQFSDWRNVAADVKRRFPQAATHLKRLDKLFAEFDRDQSGTLDFGELRELMRQIDSKLTSLPATAQRAHQQGQYLAHKLNKLARAAPGLQANDIRDADIDAAVYKAFEYKHLGSLAYIGNSAVFDLGDGWSLAGGVWAMYAWRSIYFSQSVSFRTRLLLAMDWLKRGLFGRDLMAY
ncbi:hypothetical protein RB593_008591 [Gaeumannomyces tritici]